MSCLCCGVLVLVLLFLANESQCFRHDYFQKEKSFHKRDDHSSVVSVHEVPEAPKSHRRRGDTESYRHWSTYSERQNTANHHNQQSGPRTRSRFSEYSASSGRVTYPQETVVEKTSYSSRNDRYNDKATYKTKRKPSKKATWRPISSGKYQGCRDTGRYCWFWKSIGCCEQDIGRKLCSKTCGFCSPQKTICPSSYEYGCCFDGTEALDQEKSNCPPCRNRSDRICARKAILKDCDLHEKNSLYTRQLCPLWCGACNDYSERQ
ncbi:uncharacterized protein LOC124434706 isoform X2 [Xenia sp. Carnegie-2017]|uniref:uncharacterized protein LOC124434706 isoform X2 n=1 Tax=Xenia sp. Carnegie-2017 TaxID=2897299 RepID=UPI001F03DB06|nr:uncharacterized protein LOC124434706 isoform X2 [Xenia sp. Carnegie-2017]